jgi:DNA-binding LytR/AlgR family response regulator
MLQILIIEDEIPASMLLEKMLSKVVNNYTIIGRCDTVETSVKFLKNNATPDLIFLDIQLGDGLSFDIFTQIKIQCPIIFTTAYDKFAIKAFELNSIDYLLKPIGIADLQKAIDKFQQLRQQVPTPQWDMIASLLDTEKRSYKQRFLVYAGDTLKVIPVTEIAYFYSLNSNTFLVTMNHSIYTTDMSLEKIMEVLTPENFFRINRQYIVSFQSIAKISFLSTSKLKLQLQPSPQEEIIVSSNKNQVFKEWLNR